MKRKMFIPVLLCVILLSFVGCGKDVPFDEVASNGSSTQPTSEASTVAPPPSSSKHETSTVSNVRSAGNISEVLSSSTQSTAAADSKSEKTNDNCKLIVKGKDISADNHVKLNNKHHYAELPLTAIMKKLGAKVKWQGKSSADITIDGKDYHLDTSKGTLIEGDGSFNILSIPPGSKHGTYFKAIDKEFIIDSDSAKYLIINIMGEKISIDYDENIVKIG